MSLSRRPSTSRHSAMKGQAVPQSALALSALSFGAATLGTDYNDDTSALPVLGAVRRALELGINSFDTSPYYTTSEELLGQTLGQLEAEGYWTRDTYYLCTKVGRYGPRRSDFDYSRERVRQSIYESMDKLSSQTNDAQGASPSKYLDVVYVHDVEFVADDPSETRTCSIGTETDTVIDEDKLLSTPIETLRIGSGDLKVLIALDEVFGMKEEGLVKYVGISGYPLATLLRIAYLARHWPEYQHSHSSESCSSAQLDLPHIQHLDAVLSYAQYTPQSTRLSSYALKFHENARIPYILNASPLSMGLLTASGPKEWHPAPKGLRRTAMAAAHLATQIVEAQGSGSLRLLDADRSDKDATGHDYGIAQASLAYALGLREFITGSARREDDHRVRRLIRTTIIGFSNVREVEEAFRVWRMVQRAREQSRPSSPQLLPGSPAHSTLSELEGSLDCRPLLSRSVSSDSVSSYDQDELPSEDFKSRADQVMPTLHLPLPLSVGLPDLVSSEQKNILPRPNLDFADLDHGPVDETTRPHSPTPMALWELTPGADPEIRTLLDASKSVETTFAQAGWKDWSWPSPGPNAF